MSVDRHSPRVASVTGGGPYWHAGFDREMLLLLQVARTQPGPGHARAIAALVADGVDFERLLSIAKRHKMLPLLTVNLRRASVALPDEVARRLGRYSVENAHRMLRTVGQLVEVLDALDRVGVAAVPYKGPVLGAQLYGSAALRQAGDSDILVRPADVPRARALLASLGYRPRHALSRGGEAFMVRSRYSETLDHDERTTVELHWAFTNRDIAFPLALDDLLPNLRPVPVGGAELRGFGPEDLLLTLSVHGSKHRWDRLEWVCGLAEAVRGAHGLDWDRLVERAARLGVRRMLMLGLLVAHDLLDAPVPAAVVRAAASDPAVVHAATQVPGFLVEESADSEAGSLPTDLFRYELRERWRDRARFVLYRVTTPSRPESWAALELGGLVLPVHGFLRPFQVLKKLGPAVRAVIGRGSRV